MDQPFHLFKKGQSGNPAGRPAGRRDKALMALDAIGSEAAADVLRCVVVAAKSGDMEAAKVILSRLWPLRKGRPVPFALPEIRTAADLPAAMASLTAAVADGTLTPEEGHTVAGIFEAWRRAVETADLEARIIALEGCKA